MGCLPRGTLFYNKDLCVCKTKLSFFQIYFLKIAIHIFCVDSSWIIQHFKVLHWSSKGTTEINFFDNLGQFCQNALQMKFFTLLIILIPGCIWTSQSLKIRQFESAPLCYVDQLRDISYWRYFQGSSIWTECHAIWYGHAPPPSWCFVHLQHP